MSGLHKAMCFGWIQIRMAKLCPFLYCFLFVVVISASNIWLFWLKCWTCVSVKWEGQFLDLEIPCSGDMTPLSRWLWPGLSHPGAVGWTVREEFGGAVQGACSQWARPHSDISESNIVRLETRKRKSLPPHSHRIPAFCSGDHGVTSPSVRCSARRVQLLDPPLWVRATTEFLLPCVSESYDASGVWGVWKQEVWCSGLQRKSQICSGKLPNIVLERAG